MTNKKIIFWKNTSFSFTMVGIVIFISWLMFELLSFFVSPLMNFKINCILVAPLIEEYSKRISIKKGCPWLYTYIFAFGEFFLYILFNLPAASIYFVSQRLLCVFMHFMFTAIQKEGHDSGYDKQGFGLALSCHALQNFLAIARTIGI